MANHKTILDRLICLQCGGTLAHGAESLTCAACGRVYPRQEGLPAILPEEARILHEPPQPRRAGLVGAVKRLNARLLATAPGPHYGAATGRNFDFLRAQLPAGAATILIGGGVREYGHCIDRLGTSLLADAVNLEVKAGPVVDLVADGHRIPFPDATFDLAVSEAVLEHTRAPALMVAEMLRVLKPGGWVFVGVPFLQPVHMHSDFWRFTVMGLEEMMKDFTQVESGVNGGVASATAWVNGIFLAQLFSGGHPGLYKKGRMLFMRLTAPLKYLDAIFARQKLPPIAPSSVYYIGRKPAPPAG